MQSVYVNGHAYPIYKKVIIKTKSISVYRQRILSFICISYTVKFSYSFV